jgi:hypothetical protein
VFIVLLLPSVGHGWNEEDHQVMTRLSLEEVAHSWRLDQPCRVRPLQSLLDKLAKIRPELGDAWHFSDYLKINPKINLEKRDPQVGGKENLAPLEILSLYSIDPDDGRDQNLFIRDERGNPRFAYPDQKWFGILQGPDSQAFRHMGKPPFRWNHPSRTFGIPLRALGEATERAEIYFQAALVAFSLGEEYWGWRILAGALHYLEDLHQPYHAGQITPDLLFECFKAYFSWGRKEKGFIGTCAHLVSNSHRFYESYVSHPEDLDHGAKGKALQSLKGETLLPLPEKIRNLAIQVRDSSNLRFHELLSAVTQATDPILLGPMRFEAKEYRKNPSKFLKKGSPSEEANRTIFEVTHAQFESAGRSIRTVIKASIQRHGTKTAEELLKELDKLLYPTSS